MSQAQIEEFCRLGSESIKLLQRAFERFDYSARSYHKFLKVARSFADIGNEEKIGKQHILKALMCRDLDREKSSMAVVF
jgi:magnesium chelatase family protein